MARRVLLDALDALGEQKKCVVLVGAQAVYLRAGGGGMSVTPYTTDADLLVPEAVGGEGRRAARIPPHDERVARKVRGLEGVLFDHDPMTIDAMDPADLRRHEILVAGPGALLVAKIHKIRERLAEARRATGVAKDALDVVRLLRGCREEDTAARLQGLLSGASSGDRVREATAAVSAEAVEFLRAEFGVTAGRGCSLAAAAAVGAMEEAELRASTVELTSRVLGRLDSGRSV